MKSSWLDSSQQQTIGLGSTNCQTTFQQEQHLYDHLLEKTRTEPPEALLNRFYALFIQGVGYSEHQVWQAIKQIVDSPKAEKEFKFILNRSCHILINHWLMQPRLHSAIPELIAQFEVVPGGQPRSRTTKRLRTLVQQFKTTEQYAALQRLAQVLNQAPDWGTHASTKPLGTLIRRYPCLYEHNLLTQDSTEEQRHRVRQIRRQNQLQFERDLARYATHRLLNQSIVTGDTILLPPAPDARSIRNPTLLTDRQLDLALHHFGGKVDGSNTYRDLAHRFVTYSSHSSSFRSFKDDLYDYLTESIDPKYGNRQFNHRLHTVLKNALPEHDAEALNDVLMVGVCRRLLNFLVVDHPSHLNHGCFVDLTGNLGITTTIGLLLKVVLICRKVKPCLEKRLAILFNHYETCAREAVNWLVESLENLNVAFSINFGTLSL